MNEYPEIFRQFNHKILSDDGTLKFDLMISLKDIATAKSFIYLWSSKENQRAIVKHYHDLFKQESREFVYDLEDNKELNESRDEIEKIVASQVLTLPLPNPVIRQLKDLISIFGNCIFNWIDYHDKYIFETKKPFKYCAADLIKHLKWTTRGKIDCAQTAKAILVNESKRLTNDHKYKLACTYCLQEEIVTIAPFVINLEYLINLNVEDNPMVYFWSAHITDSKKITEDYYCLCEYRGRDRNHVNFDEYIFWFLLSKSSFFVHILKEVPLKFVWNRLDVMERNKYVSGLIQNLGNEDFRYILLSNLDYYQQAEVFKECCYIILIHMLDDWLWEKYFLPTTLHVLELIEPSNYVMILEGILMKRGEKIKNGFICDQYEYFFKILWKKRPLNVKQFMIDKEHYLLMLTDILSWERDLDIIELIFQDLDTTQKQGIILGYPGISKCTDWIINGQWDLLHLFIKYCHLYEEDIRNLKRYITQLSGKYIVEICSENDAFENVDSFMNWAFGSDEDRRRFKQQVSSWKIRHDLNLLETFNETKITKVENCLKWCFSNDPIIIKQFKIRVAERFFFQLVSKLVQKDKYELLDQILNWCFSGDQNYLIYLKRNAYNYRDQVVSIKSLVSRLIREDQSFGKVNKFIDWWCSSAEEAQEFRKWITHFGEHVSAIVNKIVLNITL